MLRSNNISGFEFCFREGAWASMLLDAISVVISVASVRHIFVVLFLLFFFLVCLYADCWFGYLCAVLGFSLLSVWCWVMQSV